jgi:RTX calcium-binding nonapeptide repeat (4 copies)
VLTLRGQIKPQLVLEFRALCVTGLGCLFDLPAPVDLPASVNWDYPCHPSPVDVANIVGNTLTMGLPTTINSGLGEPNGCCGQASGEIGSTDDADVRASLIYGSDGSAIGLRIQRANGQHNEIEDFSFVDPNAGTIVDGQHIGGYIGGGKVTTLILYGTNGKNTITIDPDITYYGGGGSDVIYGSDDGADIIDGGAGDDTVFARGGNDTVNGGPGNDILYGGPGDDTLSGNDGSDLILGEAGHATLYGNSAGTPGAANEVDYLYGDFGSNGNEAGSGNDYLYGESKYSRWELRGLPGSVHGCSRPAGSGRQRFGRRDQPLAGIITPARHRLHRAKPAHRCLD